MVRREAAALALIVAAACGGSRQPSDGAVGDAGLDAPGFPDAGDVDADAAMGDAGSSCTGSLIRVEATLTTGRDQIGYALAPVPRLVTGPDRDMPLDLHEMIVGEPERLPPSVQTFPYPASDPTGATLVAAVAPSADLTALVFQAGSVGGQTEVVVLDSGAAVRGRVDVSGVSRMEGVASEQVVAGRDRVAVVGGDGSGNVRVRLVDSTPMVLVDMELTGRQDPVAVARGDGFTVAVVDRIRAYVELYTLSDAGLSLSSEYPTPGPVLELALSGDHVATALRENLVLLSPDGTFEMHPLPEPALTEGYINLQGIDSPIGASFALQVGTHVWVGVLTSGGFRWEQSSLQYSIGLWLHGGEREAGAYIMSRNDVTPRLDYIGLRCPD